ncbi:MFS transporter [Methanocella arvoryzae]|uniref:Permease (Major facilitator superfamily) n=1 Tax=Methanocella arvoryzae (strain DSM 22066 / NBRC 105507 / MRE50) TaxID=351160 RepID=Q0W0Z1_METAR|nr:MFS transporter [Methanocella arvoryzae]CAJ37952.1 putative permease (major facilitator superfamily) [Methanocella arvoryzae MRE50]
MVEAIDRKMILLITGIAAFITPFLGASMNVALPQVGAEFQPDAVLLGWVVTAYLLSTAIFIVPFGRLSDMYGRRIVFIAGMTATAVFTLMSAVSDTIWLLLLSRVLQGIGSAMIFGTSVAILTSSFPPKDRGKVLGINVALVYLGLSLGPVVGGIITQQVGWRYIFVLNGVLSLIALGFTLWKLKEDVQCAEKAPFDIGGCAIYGIMLFALMYGLSLLPDISGAFWIVGGLVALAIFIWWELRHKAPVVKLSLFVNNVSFTFSNAAALINYSATFSVSFLLSLYLQYIKGMDPQTAGLILIAAPVMQAVLSPLAGRLSDRMEPQYVASAGMAITTVGLLLFTLLSSETSLLYIVGSLILIGLGFALFSSPNTNAIMSSVDRCDYGVASGMVSTMRLVGQMLSLGIAMLTFSVFIGRVQITPEQYPLLITSIKVAFIISAVLCAAGILASMARGKMRKNTSEPVVQKA